MVLKIEISYKKITFNEPSKLSFEEYNKCKSLLSVDPNSQIFVDKISFISTYKKTFWFLVVLALITCLFALLGQIIFEKGSDIYIIILLTMIVQFFLLILRLILEAESYVSYKLKRRGYFNRMKKDILESEDYDDFLILFYVDYSQMLNDSSVAELES